MITANGEHGKKDEDKIKRGYDFYSKEGAVRYNMAGSFLLWRGATMKEESISSYV